MALSAKAKNGSLIVLDNLDVADGKTKVLAGQREKLGLNKALFIDGDDVNVSFAKESSNLNGVNVMPAMGANVYDTIGRASRGERVWQSVQVSGAGVPFKKKKR